jgi:Dolichyl-phosphate-mannose-protein mannosyltransferase
VIGGVERENRFLTDLGIRRAWRSIPPWFLRVVPLIAVVLLGGWLRFRHLDWATGYYFQPDENAFTVEYVLHLPPSLNPYEVGPYTYGGLPLYLYYFSARALAGMTHDPVWLDKWHITLISRTYSAVASTLTVVLLYLLWRQMSNARLGWIAALAFAVSPLSIQYAHYGAVDTLLVFWIVLVSFLSVWAWTSKRQIVWLFAGLALGFAVATKVSGLLWGLGFIVAAWGCWSQNRDWRAALSVLGLSGVGTLIGVLGGSPYYVLDWQRFSQTMTLQNSITVTGDILTTYHWQFLKVMPFVFELRQLGLWAIGLPLAVLGIVGVLWLWRDTLRSQKHWVWWLVLVSPTIYFITIGLWHSKFIRYLLPVIPWVCLGAAQPFAVALKSRFLLVRWGTAALTMGAILYSGVLGTAVSNVYAGSDPRVAASEWMVKNIPAGATILHDPEPLITLPLGASEHFQIHILDLYGNQLRNLNNVDWFAQSIRDQQYVVIVSRRNYATILYLDALFPTAACYYRSLFNGDLGYRQAAHFSNYPHLGPFVWNTDTAEETFQVFDHPNVFIFERQQTLKIEEIAAVLEKCVSR